MNASRLPAPGRVTAKTKLIDAAHALVRRQGYAATTVDEICNAAGVTKGAFFHHFVSKEALAVAAAEHWTIRAAPLFELPPYTRLADPLDRLIGHIDMRLTMIDGPAEGFTCFAGTMVQEAFASSDAIRAACDASFNAYCEALAIDIQATMDLYGTPEGTSALGLARHVQSVLQGAFVLSKAAADPAVARESVMHLRHYVLMLFDKGDKQ
jgi:TetR/AcrR family transcriptional regulator, transcriptional repressor for nem operon